MILVSLVIPVASVGGFDLVALALGNPMSVILGEALAGVLTGPPYEVHDPESGKAHDIFPCAIEEGRGVRLPLGKYGDLAVFVRQGELVVACPAAVVGVARNSLSALIADGRCRYLGVGPGPEGFTGSFGLFSFKPVPGASWMLRIVGVQIGFVFDGRGGSVAT